MTNIRISTVRLLPALVAVAATTAVFAVPTMFVPVVSATYVARPVMSAVMVFSPTQLPQQEVLMQDVGEMFVEVVSGDEMDVTDAITSFSVGRVSTNSISGESGTPQFVVGYVSESVADIVDTAALAVTYSSAVSAVTAIENIIQQVTVAPQHNVTVETAIPMFDVTVTPQHGVTVADNLVAVMTLGPVAGHLNAHMVNEVILNSGS